MGRWAGLVAALAAAACQFPSPTDVLPDAPPVDGPVDARPDLVTGTVSIGYRTEAGVTERYTDLSSVAIAALVPDAAEPSGFRTIVGTGTADGRFTIEGVPPEGEYYLKVGNRYYVTTHHAPRIRSVVPGRSDVERVRSPTPVSVDVPESPGGRSNYLLAVVSTRAGVVFEPHYQLGSSQAAGDWANTLHFHDGTVFGGRPEAGRGDDLRLVQYRVEQRGPGIVETTATRSAILSASIIDGQAQHLSGAAAPVPTSISVRVTTGNRGVLDAQFDDRSEFEAAILGVYAPLTAEARWLTVGGDVLGPVVAEVSTRDGTPTAPLPTLIRSLPDPFTEVGVRTVAMQYLRRWWYRIPTSSIPVSMVGGVVRVATELDLPFSRGPSMPPPSGITVAGRSGASGGAAAPSGLALRWTGVLGARQYSVSVLRIVSTGVRFSGAVFTVDPTVLIPQELLTGADYFAFAVTAFAGTNAYTEGALYPDGFPADQSTNVTGPFLISVACGNGAIDPGETCDGAGTESASCDLDCTARECGDGVRNATAGEVCDAIVDTAGCDADCTAVTCGDGHVNLEVEQCDDGNAVDDGNGCGADCRFNRCGDGVVQPYGQECDTVGASATCDADCTLVVCGDYVINAAAGETCDDGSASSGDGCSATCQLE